MNNSIFPLVIFKDYQCKVRPVLYPEGNPGLVLEDAIDGSAVATATVNLPVQLMKITDMLKDTFPVQPYEVFHDKYGSDIDNKLYVFIKDYSENEGMLETLLKAGVVNHYMQFADSEPCEIFASSGYIEQVPFVYVCHASLIQAFNQLYAETASEDATSYREPSTELEYIFFK